MAGVEKVYKVGIPVGRFHRGGDKDCRDIFQSDVIGGLVTEIECDFLNDVFVIVPQLDMEVTSVSHTYADQWVIHVCKLIDDAITNTIMPIDDKNPTCLIDRCFLNAKAFLEIFNKVQLHVVVLLQYCVRVLLLLFCCTLFVPTLFV